MRFAGVDAANANTRSDAYAAGALVFTSADAESCALADDLPDEAVYDSFFATHTAIRMRVPRRARRRPPPRRSA